MPEPASQVILRTQGLTKRFGGFYALKDLFFEVRSGDIHSVIGPNGAGKTTLFNIISGTLEPDAGEIAFEDRTFGRIKCSGRTMLGIARTFQNIRLFGQMTVSCWAAMDERFRRCGRRSGRRLPIRRSARSTTSAACAPSRGSCWTSSA